jgi:hypothetical protein
MRYLLAAFTVLAATPALADDKPVDNDNMTLESLPEAARQTIEREVKSAKILEIERDQVGALVIYEVEFMEGNKRFELDVGEDGKILKPRRPD